MIGKLTDTLTSAASTASNLGTVVNAANAVNAIQDFLTIGDTKKDVQTGANASSLDNFREDSAHRYQIFFHSTTSNVENPVVTVVGFLPEEISVDIEARYTAAFGEGLLDPSAGIVQKGLRLAGVSGISQEMSVKIWESTEGINLSIPITFVAGEIVGGRQITNVIDPIMDLMSLCTPSKNKGDIFLTPPGPHLATDFNAAKQVVRDIGAFGASLLVEGVYETSIGPMITAGKALFGGSKPEVTVVSETVGLDLSTETISKNLNDLGTSISNLINFDSTIVVSVGDFLYFDNVVINSVSQNYSMILDEIGNPMQATVNVSFTTMLSPTIQDLRKIFLHHSRKGPST